MGREGQALQDLADVVARLRGPQGCPWDRMQTHESLVPYLLEEAYEVAEALQSCEPEKLKEELGDLLLQVLLHSRIEHEHRIEGELVIQADVFLVVDLQATFYEVKEVRIAVGVSVDIKLIGFQQQESL